MYFYRHSATAESERPSRRPLMASPVGAAVLPRPSSYHVAVPVLAHFLAHKGIGCDAKRGDPAAAVLGRLQRDTPGFVCARDIILESAEAARVSVVLRALLGRLVMPDFPEFARNVRAISQLAQVCVCTV